MSQSQEKQKEKMPSIISEQYLTPVGNKIQPIYELQYDEKSKKELAVITGEQDIDDFIQKSASSTDMAFLVREAQRTGQYPVDARAQYGVDMTLMPTNIHELYGMTSDINAAYAKLPKEAQGAFGSAESYRDAVLSGSAEKMINDHFLKLAEEAKKAAKEQEGGDK